MYNIWFSGHLACNFEIPSANTRLLRVGFSVVRQILQEMPTDIMGSRISTLFEELLQEAQDEADDAMEEASPTTSVARVPKTPRNPPQAPSPAAKAEVAAQKNPLLPGGILPSDLWYCKNGCDKLPATPGTLAGLATHYRQCSRRSAKELTEDLRRKREDILTPQAWVCKFACDTLPAERGTRNNLRHHYQICPNNPNNNDAMLAAEKWRCKNGCTQLPSQPGCRRDLKKHYQTVCPL